ncbi:MAG: flagellar protein FlgN [Marinagarivorans sp.]|nr:flagellar protein FlgN [Marinagarivorans sp.]
MHSPQNIDETQAAKILKRNIQVSTQCCENLLQMLQQEQTFLKTRNFDQLDILITKKSELLKQLEQCVIQREQWITSIKKTSGTSIQKTSIQDKNTENTSSAEVTASFALWAKKNNLADAWRNHQTLSKSCQHANEVNGKLMLRNQATHKQLLDILRGNQGSGALYTEKGTKNSGPSRNTLGEA